MRLLVVAVVTSVMRLQSLWTSTGLIKVCVSCTVSRCLRYLGSVCRQDFSLLVSIDYFYRLMRFWTVTTVQYIEYSRQALMTLLCYVSMTVTGEIRFNSVNIKFIVFTSLYKTLDLRVFHNFFSQYPQTPLLSPMIQPMFPLYLFEL